MSGRLLPRHGAPAALLLVDPEPLRPAWRAVEGVLAQKARHWTLLDPAPGADTLAYRVRLRAAVSAADVLREVMRQGAGDVRAARFAEAGLPGAGVESAHATRTRIPHG